jgi:hypothetical protein
MSAAHPVDRIKIRVTHHRNKNKQAITLQGNAEVVILETIVNVINPRASMTFPLSFLFEHED